MFSIQILPIPFAFWFANIRTGLLFLCLLVDVSDNALRSGFSIDWSKYMPDTCFGALNFTLPDEPIDVGISVKIFAIYDISEEKMEFGIQLFMGESWKDPFMNFTKLTYKKGFQRVPEEIWKCIWKPDTIINNAKKETLYQATKPNIFYKFWLAEEEFFRGSRYNVRLACPMKFEYYPMDSQFCSLNISLLESTHDDINLTWHPRNSNWTLSDHTPLHYNVKTLKSTKSSFTYEGSIVLEFLQENFLFERSLSASIFNTYIPSFLVVCLSMVSFWLDVDAVPGRVTLGVTAILTLSTQIVQARSGLPVLDYMTAMDVWLLTCLVMVFLSLIEFTFAHSFTRKKKELSHGNVLGNHTSEIAHARKDKELDLNPRPRIRKRNEILQTYVKELPKNRVVATILQRKKDNIYDATSRIVFPCVMITFSCGYWSYYLLNAYAKR